MPLRRIDNKVEIDNPSSAIDSEVMVYGSDDGGTTPRVIKTDADGSLILSAPQGTGSDGSVQLTSANTWKQVPPSGSVPAGDYQLIVSLETATGTIRFSFSNGGTPGAGNGNLAPDPFALKLGGSEVIYYGSTDADDYVNWTAKEIV